MLNEGFFLVTFSTTAGSGEGLVMIKGDAVQGGDFGYLYHGSLSTQTTDMISGTAQAHLKITRYRTNQQSVFGPLAAFDLKLDGTCGPASFRLEGRSPQAPGLTIRIDGTRVGNLL